MWKVALLLDTAVVALFWLLAQVAIAPVDNLLVEYAETSLDLPTLTAFAVETRQLSALLPAGWAVLAVWLAYHLRGQPSEQRNTWLVAHAAASACVGLAILTFFALAGILPILKIGPPIG